MSFTGPWPARVAHRCGGRLAPENTLEGLAAAAVAGAQAVEFDVRLSRDATPVLMHDADLLRCCGVPGLVSMHSDAALAALHVQGSSARIPTLDAALERCAALGLAANVELKCERGDGQDAARLLAEVEQCLAPRLARQPLLCSSFAEDLLARLHRALPSLPLGLLVDALPADWRDRLSHSGGRSIHVAAACLRPEVLRELVAARCPVQAWAVDDPRIATGLLAAGVEAVISNEPEIFAAERPSGTGEAPS